MEKLKINFVSIFAIFVVATLTVGYVFVSGNMYKVSAGLQKSWDVSFDKNNYTSSGAGVDGNGPTISDNSIDFNVVFTNQGEYKSYVFSVLNTGNINAILKKVEVISSSENSDYLDFSYVVYKDNDIITSSTKNSFNETVNHLYRTAGVNTVEVTIMYRNFDEQIENQLVTANYKLALTYEQIQ